MNLMTELKIGEKIEIYPFKSRMNITSRTITSQLTDIKDNKLFISNPIKQGASYPLHTGQKIIILFYRDEKGIFSFTGEVLQRVDMNIPIYIIKPISDPEKNQRRLYFRLKTLMKVMIRSLDSSNAVEGFTKDISGGGLRVATKTSLKPGEKVECTLFLSDSESATLVGEVIRSIKDPITNEFELGIKYMDITDSTRNEIIAFVFKKQRELRQKGLM
ncbi:c-di-GMP-binding flagellar brake protein YcgR, contains PilZNR and PilZ domains [Natronincola peptidivorans]|uniref:C-di-GMP-binding flagellar brake protein YcgR, contains PilZNR and PilZ domains n=1 Tax=Natronincola peptidivorans TaxID=426128 RepID=A0A1H9YFR8_9FIRM|nr:flagellar brake protein [Natronincola peptidivorans]SES67876.1 c-di-GMP-binding flagellar brake protein YcgR, contains PilZNR and PilZ domains [Natronincola peptidivorans]